MSGSPPIRFRLWNNDVIEPHEQPARFTLHLADPKALYTLATNPNLAFGDLYSAGRLGIKGDLPDLTEALYRAIHQARQKWPRWLEALWRNHAPRSTGLSELQENIHHHYDLGNDFYRLWLDQAEMQYTCAYYERPDLSLEQAQLAKLEHVCRKLRLKPGMTVVEAECGWGGLGRYMARNYGVKVHAYNISHEQVIYARTLSAWMERLNTAEGAVSAMYDEHFTRAWRMYLAGSIAAFRAGSLQLFQVVFTHGDNNQLPATRQDLYNFPAAPEGT